ncbi:hypothetical protein [Moorena producens]|uniref:hypothetical protein n=1 Tax=Moorena producens TaxID=1155739 RepID=UPI000A460BD4|nr:hypothetical protein [Moorena producens]
MQSLMGETTAVAHGGNPQDRTASPRPRCIANYSLSPVVILLRLYRLNTIVTSAVYAL